MMPLQYLDKAWGLIKDPEHWTQRASARSSDLQVVDPRSVRASKWCSSGALCAVEEIRMPGDAITRERRIVRDALNRAAAELDTLSHMSEDAAYITLNDRTTHEMTMRMWDRARQILVEQGHV